MRRHRLLAIGFLLMVCDLAFGQKAGHFLNKPAATWAIELKSKDAGVRRSAAYALGKCGADADPYVNALRQALTDDDEGVREAAAGAFGDLGRLIGEPAIPDLREHLVAKRENSALVRRAAATALGKLRAIEAIGDLRDALGDRDASVRQNAAWALGAMEPAKAAVAVPQLIRLLSDDDLLVRRDVALALGNMGPAAKEAVPALVKALSKPSEDDTVRNNLVRTLGEIGPDAAAAVPVLAAILKDLKETEGDEELRRKAILAVGQIGGPQVGQAMEPLKKALRDRDPLLREVAAAAFANLGEEAHAVVPELTLALADEKVEVRRNAGVALHKAFPVTKSDVALRVAPRLLEVLDQDADIDVRKYVAWTLLQSPVRLKSIPKARELLIRVALDKELGEEATIVRYETARIAVIHFGVEAREVTPTLIEYLKDDRLIIIDRTGAKTNTTGGETTTGTTKVEETGKGDGRLNAVGPLADLGKAGIKEGERAQELAKAAKEALEEAAKDPKSKELREEAKRALRRF